MPGDMVVSGYWSCPLAIRSSGLGISEQADIARTDEKSNIVSRHFHRQIIESKDIETIIAVIAFGQNYQQARLYLLAGGLFAP